MSFQLQPLTAAQRFAQLKLNPALTIQKQTWEKEGYQLAENQAAIPQGAEQRTFVVPGRANELANSNGRTQVPNPGSSFLFYKGGAPEPAPAAAAPAPAAPAAPMAIQPQVAQSIVPQLQGTDYDVRKAGEDIGIKRASSSSRKSKGINKGTSQLTIPRSSGSSSLNIA
jgi:hypothetical protein